MAGTAALVVGRQPCLVTSNTDLLFTIYQLKAMKIGIRQTALMCIYLLQATVQTNELNGNDTKPQQKHNVSNTCIYINLVVNNTQKSLRYLNLGMYDKKITSHRDKFETLHLKRQYICIAGTLQAGNSIVFKLGVEEHAQPICNATQVGNIICHITIKYCFTAINANDMRTIELCHT